MNLVCNEDDYKPLQIVPIIKKVLKRNSLFLF